MTKSSSSSWECQDKVTPRVLHIGKFYPPVAGGIENFLGDLLPALNRKETSAAALVHDMGQKQDPVDQGKTIVFRVPCHGTLLYVPISPMFPFAMKKAIQAFRPDILHFHVPNTSAFWALTLPAARALPWVVHWHADVVPSVIDRRMTLAYQLYRPIEKLFLQHAQSIIATSQSYLNTSSALVDFKDKCHIIPLGLDPARLKKPGDAGLRWAEAMWGQPGGRILVIGRLTYYKGHEVMLDASTALPDARILFVGNGEREYSLQRRIHTLDLSRNVSLLGSLPEPDLHALIASCDCLCLPSVERTEAFGLVLLEAMRYGKPVVASSIPGSGIGWVVEDGVTGFLVPPGDPVLLAESLRRLMDRPELKSQMGRSALERFRKVFQIDHIARKVILLYHQTLKALKSTTGYGLHPGGK
ncbi:MAG: glycosyltransferase [Deltaproteobacteria bacterium]|nr:glycosyltransferase [Deltaproteobacteria bacterium]